MLLLKEHDSLWKEQGWSSARKSLGLSRKTPPAKEGQTTSTSRSLRSASYKKSRPTKTKSRSTQTDVGNTAEFPLLDNFDVLCGLKQVRAKRNTKDMAAPVAKTRRKVSISPNELVNVYDQRVLSP